MNFKRQSPKFKSNAGYVVYPPQLIHTENVYGEQVAILMDGWHSENATCYVKTGGGKQIAKITRFVFEDKREVDTVDYDLLIHVDVDISENNEVKCDEFNDPKVIRYDSCTGTTVSSDTLKISHGTRMDVKVTIRTDLGEKDGDDPNKICKLVGT